MVAGPTAVGKTAVAIELAQQLQTVILSADSRQCYRELNIGVARPSPQELEAVPHYFIASHSIQQKIDAALYEAHALTLLRELFQQYHTVVVTGGTGLYIKALIDGLDDIPAIPEHIRKTIVKNVETEGIEWLQQQLLSKDSLFASQGEMQNPQRMMRALEVVEGTGRSIISFRSGSKAKRNFDITQIGLEMPRETLNNRINTRVDSMMEAGLEQEARSLIPHRHMNGLQTVGYKEMFDYFDGSISLHQASDLIKQNTRRYAKRQMTWFKRQSEMIWFDVSQVGRDTLINSILNY